MEGRRIEGVFLESSILRNRAQEAYETAKVYEIQILSRIPKALLASLGGPGTRLKATVKDVSARSILLLLENGYEVTAENRLNLPVKVGEELVLMVESENPLTLRPVLLRLNQLRESVEGSGILYEKNVWDYLRGILPLERLTADSKFILLKALESTDLSAVLETLKEVSPPPPFAERIEQLLEEGEGNNRIAFLRNLMNLEREISEAISDLSRKKEALRESVGGIVKTLTNNILGEMERLGLRIGFRRDVFEGLVSSPRTLSIFREAIKSLELNRWNEFSDKLNLLGIRIENRELLPIVKESLLPHMRSLLRGALVALKNQTETEDPLKLALTMKELEDRVNNLEKLREAVSRMPEEVKENLARLESIAYLQAYLVATAGRRFVLPFRTGEGKGVIGFSSGEAFRIFIRLNFEDSYIGIMIEAPRKENPDHLSVVFKTDSEYMAEAIAREEESLWKDLGELGLDVKRFEIVLDTADRERKRKAVALRYAAGKDIAPVVVAKGRGELAERIIEIARREGIPVLEDKALVEALLKIEIFEEIPPVLYEAVLPFLKSETASPSSPNMASAPVSFLFL